MEASSSKVCKNQLDQSLLGVTADPALGGAGVTFQTVLFCFLLFLQYMKLLSIMTRLKKEKQHYPEGWRIHLI